MSVENVRAQIEKFLKSKVAEVLCIRGHWGTGKTYTWMEALKEASGPNGGLASEKYAYVSLFGQNSLDDVKRELFYQTINRDRIGKDFNIKDISGLFNGLPQIASWGSKFASAVFGVGYSSIGEAIMYLTVRDRLICIDDLERKGSGLRSVDVLGLISQLKEDRNCKVVLLLNNEQLEDRAAFESFLEKVVDVNLRFAPSPLESASIALDGQEGDKNLKDLVQAQTVTLGIDNVRVIRKIFRTASDVAPMLKKYKPGVLKAAVKSIVLFGWAYHQPEMAPPLDYIRSIGEYSSITENPDQRLEALKQQWWPVLQRYGYIFTDAFDELLNEGVVNGYFNPATVAAHGEFLHRREQAEEANAELDDAWNLFHRSFQGDVDDVAAKLLDCVERNAIYYSFGTVAQVVDLLQRLERKAEAEHVFEVFVKVHEGNIGIFDLDRLARFGYELPADILARVLEMTDRARPDLSNDELFLSLKENGFGSEEAAKLAKLPVAEYVRVLSSHTGEELQRIRNGLTDFVTVSNPIRPQLPLWTAPQVR